MPLRFDATLKGMLERGPADWPALLGISGDPVDVVDADVSTFTGASDKVLLVHGPFDWIMDINFQRGPDASVPKRVHLYNGLLENRHNLLVRSVVVLLSPKANLSVINGRYVRSFPGEEPHVDFRYHVVRVWELPVATLLKGGFGTLPLAAISDVREEELPGVVATIKERLSAPDAPLEATDLWTATYVLMGLRYPEPMIQQLLQGVTSMEESVTYQAIKNEGRIEGRVEEAQKTVLLQGREKFGEPPPEVRTTIEGISDLGRLHPLLVRLLKVDSWQALVQ